MVWRKRSSSDDAGNAINTHGDVPSIVVRGDREGSSGPSTSTSVDYSSIQDTCSSKPDGWGTRHTLAILGFLGFAVSYGMRVNLSMAIVAMTGSNSSSTTVNVTDVCPALLKSSSMSSIDDVPGHTDSSGEFDWNGEDQGIILGSFFWGYVVLQVPGGMLAERIGGKWPFGIGMLVTAIFSLLTPLAARSGKGVLIACRIIQGLGEGITNPSMHAILARWLPPLERSRIGAFIYLGCQAGTVITLPLCGYLISSNFMGGWPSVFYVMGIAGILWFIAWCFFVFDTPKGHPRIEAKELSYIQHSIGLQMSKHKVPTPWRKMLTSMPVIAILVVQTGHGWGLYTLLTELPTYLKTILHFDMKSNGYVSAVPYLAMTLFGLVCCWYADYLRENQIATTTTVRKLFVTIAHFASAVFLLGMAYSGCDRVLAVVLITISIGLNGAGNASFQINHIDIASNHAGVMMGVTNGFANLMGIVAPYVAGVIIRDGSSLDNWRLIFVIAAVVLISDNVFYLIFGSGEEQSWNRDPRDALEEASRKQSQNRIISDDDRQPLLSDGSN